MTGVFELILLISWLATHSIYRAGVGTYCAIKGTEPPWVANRRERLVKQETAKARRYEAMRSKRTLRGFFGRLWGDLWEDAHHARDRARTARANRVTTNAPRRRLRDRIRDWMAGSRRDTKPATIPDAPVLETTEPTPAPVDPGELFDAQCMFTRDIAAQLAVLSGHQHIPDGLDRCPEPAVASIDDWIKGSYCQLHKQLLVEIHAKANAATETPTPPAEALEAAFEPAGLAPGPGSESASEPPPADSRRHLTIVPIVVPAQPQGDSTQPQGAQPMADAMPVEEITNIQALRGFADQVQQHGNRDWPEKLEAAEAQLGQAGMNNDPAITSSFGQMREAAAMFASAGAALRAALVPHEQVAEQVSGLGTAAADRTAVYQNQ